MPSTNPLRCALTPSSPPQLQLLPSSPLALYNLASLLHRRRRGGDASEAQSLYTSALALGPSTARAPAATNLGLLLGRSPGGLEHLSMAYGLRPSHLPTITAYADALLDAGDAEGSVSLFHRAAKADPTSARAAVGHARALAASRGGAGEEVIRAYTNAVALSPGSPVALSGLGAALQDSGVGQGEARELYRCGEPPPRSRCLKRHTPAPKRAFARAHAHFYGMKQSQKQPDKQKQARKPRRANAHARTRAAVSSTPRDS